MRQGFTLIELMIVIAIIAIIAAIAIPNLLESRVTANEAAASASLKSGVFPAQVQFQAGGYQDLDQDNVGEYGTLRALAGVDGTNKIIAASIKLLTGPLGTASSWSGAPGSADAPAFGLASGYMFAAFAASESLPDGTPQTLWHEGQVAPGSTTGVALTAGNVANNGERYWIAACAPERFGDSGRRPFCISEDGQIRSPASSTGVASFYTTVAMVNDPSYTGTGVTPQIPDPSAVVAVAQGQAVTPQTFSVGVRTIYGETQPMANDFALWSAAKGFPVYSK